MFNNLSNIKNVQLSCCGCWLLLKVLLLVCAFLLLFTSTTIVQAAATNKTRTPTVTSKTNSATVSLQSLTATKTPTRTETTSESVTGKTETGTNSSSLTPFSQTRTFSATISHSKTVTISDTKTVSKSVTFQSQTVTKTVSKTLSRTVTETAANTKTLSLDETASNSSTRTISPISLTKSSTLFSRTTTHSLFSRSVTLSKSGSTSLTITENESESRGTETGTTSKSSSFTTPLTPTETMSHTKTFTLSQTLFSLSATLTRSQSATDSEMETKSLTSTVTASDSRSKTSSNSSSLTESSSVSKTKRTRSISVSETETDSPTKILTPTGDTFTFSSTPTETKTPTFSIPTTKTHTKTFSLSFELTETNTSSFTDSESDSQTQSTSQTLSPSESQTRTSSPSVSRSITSSFSESRSRHTETAASVSATDTPPHTFSVPQTETGATFSPSNTPTETRSHQPTETDSASSTNTHLDTESLSQTFSHSLSDPTATPSYSGSLPIPIVSTRYCDLFGAGDRWNVNKSHGIIKNNFFDPHYYSPCCEWATEKDENNVVINTFQPLTDLEPNVYTGNPTVASCYSSLVTCINNLIASPLDRMSAGSMPTFNGISAVNCSDTSTTAQADALVDSLMSCADQMVSCSLRAAPRVRNTHKSPCSWSPGVMASISFFRGISSDYRSRSLVTTDCTDFKNQLLAATTGCSELFTNDASSTESRLSNCLSTINSVGYLVRGEISQFSPDFAKQDLPTGLVNGFTMGSDSLNCNPGICISPQGTSSCQCSAKGHNSKSLRIYPAEFAFAYSDTCAGSTVSFSLCQNADVNQHLDSEIDFYLQTAPVELKTGIPVFPGFFNASPGTLAPAAARSNRAVEEEAFGTEDGFLSSNRRATEEIQCIEDQLHGTSSTTFGCTCPRDSFYRRFLLPAPGKPFATYYEPVRRWVTFCAPITTNIFIIDHGDGACYQPLLKSSQVIGNFSCTCLAGSKNRVVPLAYINETTGKIGPGLLVMCDQPPVQFRTLQDQVTTAISALAGLIGGPAMALLQAAVVTTLVDCNSDDSSKKKNALLPFSIGEGVLSSWLTVVLVVILIIILQFLMVVALYFWRRKKVDDEKVIAAQKALLEEQEQNEEEMIEDGEYYYEEGEEEEDGSEQESGDDEEESSTTTRPPSSSSSSSPNANINNIAENPLAVDPRSNSNKKKNKKRRNLLKRRDSTMSTGSNNNNEASAVNNGRASPMGVIQRVNSTVSDSASPTKQFKRSNSRNSNKTFVPKLKKDSVIDHGEDFGNTAVAVATTMTTETPKKKSTLERRSSVIVEVPSGKNESTPVRPAVVQMSQASTPAAVFVEQQKDSSMYFSPKEVAPAPPILGSGSNNNLDASVNQFMLSTNINNNNNNSSKRKKSVIIQDDDDDDEDTKTQPPNNNEDTQNPLQQDLFEGEEENQHPHEEGCERYNYYDLDNRPNPDIHLMEDPPEDIEFSKIVDTNVYRAIPLPSADETWMASMKYACCMARFPYVSMLAGRLAFQGFAYDTFLLLLRNPVGSTNGVAGGFGVVMCFFWTFFHLYLADYIQNHETWIYREYTIAFNALPKIIPRRVLPHGFWHNSPFLLCFRAAVDLYVGEEKYLRHISWGTYFRMMLVGFTVAFPTPKKNCIAVYITLLIIMWVSAIMFVVFRPHRRPVDDIINVLLSFLNGLMIIFIVQPHLGNSNDIFLSIVYIALSSMCFTFVYAACEFFWWNRLEVRVAEEHEIKNIEDEIKRRDLEIEERYEELERLRQLFIDSEWLCLHFEHEEAKMRRRVMLLERKARAKVTFCTQEDDQKVSEQAARASKFATVDGISGDEARAENNNKKSRRKSSSSATALDYRLNNEQDDEEEFDDDDDENLEIQEGLGNESTMTSLTAIRRMRMAARRRRSVRIEQQNASHRGRRHSQALTANDRAREEENAQQQSTNENDDDGSTTEQHKERRHSSVHPAAARDGGGATLQTDMSDNFVHRALDVLGFF